MDVQNVINEALIGYDGAQPVIRYLLKNTEYEGIKTDNDRERTRFKFFEKNTNKLILDTEVEVLAVYYDKLQIWSWAWSQTGLRNSENYLSKEILRYALTLESDLAYIKSILTTSRGIIKDETQIDINLAIGSSFIKQPYVYPYFYHVEDSSLIYYFVLLNKEELDKLKEKVSKNNNDNKCI